MNVTSERSGFKFALQEDKFEKIKKISNLTSERLKEENKSNIISIDNIENVHKGSPFIHENDYFKSITEKFKNEIFILKSYINRINKEIRKNLNIEIPNLEDKIFNKENTENNYEDIVNFFQESLNRLINPEYLNPIFSIYDNHMINLENELKHYKILCQKNENQISELIKENSNLRNELIIKSNEMKEFLKTKIEREDKKGIIHFNIDFMKSLEERNDLLSQENEILAINYNKVSQDLLNYNLNFNEKHNENLEKIEVYDRLNEELKITQNALENSNIKNQMNEVKIYELTDIISKLELDNENYKYEAHRFRNENQSLTEANVFYKNFIHKINKN